MNAARHPPHPTTYVAIGIAMAPLLPLPDRIMDAHGGCAGIYDLLAMLAPMTEELVPLAEAAGSVFLYDVVEEWAHHLLVAMRDGPDNLTPESAARGALDRVRRDLLQARAVDAAPAAR